MPINITRESFESMDGSSPVSLLTSKPILVTGAGGWIASHVVYQALDKGYKVRGTVRSLSNPKYDFLRTFHPRSATHLELVETDLTEKGEAWDKAVDGCEYILHVASPFTFKYKDENELVKPAVEGVEAVLEASFRNPKGIKRIIQTSSVCSVVYGHENDRYKCNRAEVEAAREEFYNSLHPEDAPKNTKISENVDGDATAMDDAKAVDEDPMARILALADKRVQVPTGDALADFKLFDESEFSEPERIVGYELSKVKAELRAWELIKEHNKKFENDPESQIEMSVICPAFVFGPILDKSHKYSESGCHIRRIILKTYPFVPELNSSHVDVRDVATCHLLAMEAPKEKVDGQRFICASSDGNMTFLDQARLVSKHFKQFGFCPAVTRAPTLMIKAGAYFFASVRAAADKLHVVSYVSNKKAFEVLGHRSWRYVFQPHVVCDKCMIVRVVACVRVFGCVVHEISMQNN